MHFDLSGLQKAVHTRVRKNGFRGGAVFSIAEVVERSKKVSGRRIDRVPYKILDAPGIHDDFYMNVLDWSGDNIVVGLGESVYVYNTVSQGVDELCSVSGGAVTSIRGCGGRVLVGDSRGVVRSYDLESGKVEWANKSHGSGARESGAHGSGAYGSGAQVGECSHAEKAEVQVDGFVSTVKLPTQPRSAPSGGGRISSLAFNARCLPFFSAGDKGGCIYNYDMRMAEATGKFRGHSGEVCGLAWGSEYLASGSNDNTVRLWRMGSPIGRVLGQAEGVTGGEGEFSEIPLGAPAHFTAPDLGAFPSRALTHAPIDAHTSAVKALAWCPWKPGVLATGGGARDRTIKFWDAQSGECLRSIDTGSQVCAIQYLSKYKEIISAHGFYEGVNRTNVGRVGGDEMAMGAVAQGSRGEVRAGGMSGSEGEVNQSAMGAVAHTEAPTYSISAAYLDELSSAQPINPTFNDIRLWRSSNLRLISSFGSHDSRVLHLAVSPDQCAVASLGADESLKFWKIAEAPKKISKRDSIGLR